MGNIDLLDKIDPGRMDPKGMLKHIENFPSLCADAFQLADGYTIPPYYIKAKKIVLLGMGGSGEAGEIIKNILSLRSDLVIENVHNYTLPGFVDKDTLVIASSYSGDTEETLTGFISAYEKGAKLLAITTGGKLKILAQKYNAPIFQFNYDCPPRAAFPYLFVFLFMIFQKLGYLEVTNDQVGKAVSLLQAAVGKYGSTNPLFSNPAKILAEKLSGKIPVIYASEKLIGVGLRVKGQFNENAKNYAFSEELPELNHKSLEGLHHPGDVVFVMMLESNFEYERNLLRENITAEILSKNKVKVERIKFLQAEDYLAEILLQVIFGDFVSYYLALLNKVNPGINKVVDYLKERLV